MDCGGKFNASMTSADLWENINKWREITYQSNDEVLLWLFFFNNTKININGWEQY